MNYTPVEYKANAVSEYGNLINIHQHVLSRSKTSSLINDPRTLVINSYELSFSILIEELKKKLWRIEMDKKAIDLLYANTSYIDYLKIIQDELPKYLSNFQLKVKYYEDCDEEYNLLNVIIDCKLEVNEQIKFEEDFFTNVFANIYKSTKGKITLIVENNDI